MPRLVDFGLAVPVASEALHHVAGSPPYMAPEQARGQGERVDARTDVYGLGAVLYYLLTRRPPHGGQTLIEVIEQARDAPVVPPRRINPRVPRALERICRKATASDPQSRFQSADAPAPRALALPALAAGRAATRGRRYSARPARAGLGVLAKPSATVSGRYESCERRRRDHGTAARSEARTSGRLAGDSFRDRSFPQAQCESLRPEARRCPGRELIRGPRGRRIDRAGGGSPSRPTPT